MFENRPKSPIQHYVYIFSIQKLIKSAKKAIFASFWKPEACGQTVLPILIGQKFVENIKTKKYKCDILGDFQTLWLMLTPIGFPIEKVKPLPLPYLLSFWQTLFSKLLKNYDEYEYASKTFLLCLKSYFKMLIFLQIYL